MADSLHSTSSARQNGSHGAKKRGFVQLDGKKLTSELVVATARERQPVRLSRAGRERASLAHAAMLKIAKQRPVYGQSTGVGANKEVSVMAAASGDHGLRLLRSHAAGAGPLVSPEIARATMVVRLNQLAAGGSGVNPALLGTLEKAINGGLTPPLTRYGAIGTGDLTALATTALCIIGERPWEGGTMPPYKLDSTDALAFISSSAATLGEASLACYDIGQRLKSALTVAALSYLAMGGSPEALDVKVHAARLHPGQVKVAADLRRLLGNDLNHKGRRIQDPYCLRALPQVHGAAVEALQRLDSILTIELNAASENPLVSPEVGEVFHNGNFYLSHVGLALDQTRAAVYNTAALSVARLGALMEPAVTGLNPFLAAGHEASSGVLITEYVARSALAELRHLAVPDSIGATVLSRGAEEHAGFATQSTWHTTASISAYETVLACELVAAVRALRQQNVLPQEGPLRGAFDLAAASLNSDFVDRSLELDIAAATLCLKEF